MKKVLIIVAVPLTLILAFSQCSQNEKASNDSQDKKDTTISAANGGFESQVKYGEHLVTIAACGDCHTPKKMTPTGPHDDSSLLLSGHPEKMPSPDVDRKEIESKGLGVTNDLTSWIGPWGISYSANITSDSTGIGNWTEAQFMLALREGKAKGLAANRQLLPPMPWPSFRFMKDEEVKAIFAYLKSTKPVKNVVPPPAPPVSAHKM